MKCDGDMVILGCVLGVLWIERVLDFCSDGGFSVLNDRVKGKFWFCFLMMRRAPRSTLFPFTALFRARVRVRVRVRV